MRTTGLIPKDQYVNLSQAGFDAYIAQFQRDLHAKFGPGTMTTMANPDGFGVDWYFDYAEGFNLLGNVEPMTPELLDALYTARVKLCNMSAVKYTQFADEGKDVAYYEPVDPDDENAAQTVRAINEIEAVLVRHGRGTNSGKQ